MFSRHFKKQLSAYWLGELDSETTQLIELHLNVCASCRLELNQIKQVAHYVGRLTQAKTPDELWDQLDRKIVDPAEPKIRESKPFIPVLVTAFVLVCLAVAGLWRIATEYSKEKNSAVGETTVVREERPVSPGPANESPSPTLNPSKNATGIITKARNIQEPESSSPAWNVEISEGSAIIGGIKREASGKLGIGEWLETDNAARAKIDVADIGYVEVDPRSRLRLANSRQDEHRLTLTQGKISALIFAPPRLFIVDTPAARAVDLGCAYTLEVDEAGNTILEVTAGWVALERDGLESFIPAGALCKTFKGKGIGTPYYAGSSPEFISVLNEIDRKGIGNSARLSSLLSVASPQDALSLWHLLAQLNSENAFAHWRGLIFDRLAHLTPPPPGVTRRKIVGGKKSSIQKWWTDVISGYDSGQYFWGK